MSSLLFEDPTRVLLQSFYSYLLLHCTSSFLIVRIWISRSVHILCSTKKKKCAVVQAVFYPNNVWKSVVQSLFKMLYPMAKILSMKMIEHIAHQMCILSGGRLLIILFYVVCVYVYKHNQCVIGLVSLRKKKEAIREEDQLFVMRHVFY